MFKLSANASQRAIIPLFSPADCQSANNRLGYVTRRVKDDMSEHLCSLSGTYFLRALKKQAEEILKGEKDVGERTISISL